MDDNDDQNTRTRSSEDLGEIISFLLRRFLSYPCLRNRTTLHFDILHLFMVCVQTCISSTRVACWLPLIFACCLVLYLYACAVENPEIPGFCVSKSIGLRTDHKRVKNIET